MDVRLISGVLVPVIAALGLDGLFIGGLVVLFKYLKLRCSVRIFAACFTCGLALGFLSVYLWPSEAAAIINFTGVFSGDWIYNTAIKTLGNPSSAQAHYTIPWLLRIPQVYAPTSIFGWGIIGAILQLMVNNRAQR